MEEVSYFYDSLGRYTKCVTTKDKDGKVISQVFSLVEEEKVQE